MYAYRIQGGRPLAGRLKIQGAKNSVLPILTATLLSPGVSVIHNCPKLSDVQVTLEILSLLGCKVEWEGESVRIDASQVRHSRIPEQLMGELRSSVVFLGALLSRCGEACMSYPGGCVLGPRPIDLHLMALRRLGAHIQEKEGRLFCSGGGEMQGRELCLPLPSVGATENAMLAACGCEGVTKIIGAAREPEIEDLQCFLNAMGAKISGAGESVLTIQGGIPLHGAEHTVMGDRIVAATYLCAVGSAGGCVRLEGAGPDSLGAVISALEQAGADISQEDKAISITCADPLCGIAPVRTAPFPGFPTDAQPPLMAALCCGIGTTMFVETIFSNRYRHVDELCRMGADIHVDGRVAVVTGRQLHASLVRGRDLRGSAALAVAALGARGCTRLLGEEYILRGYQDFAGDLRKLGAEISIE